MEKGSGNVVKKINTVEQRTEKLRITEFYDSDNVGSNCSSPSSERNFNTNTNFCSKISNNNNNNHQSPSTVREHELFRRHNLFSDINNVIDVDKVFRLISPTSSYKTETVCKTPSKTLKTYTNKRKHLYDNKIIESFGLPDISIVPLNKNKPLNAVTNTKLDVINNQQPDINIDKKFIENGDFPTKSYPSTPKIDLSTSLDSEQLDIDKYDDFKRNHSEKLITKYNESNSISGRLRSKIKQDDLKKKMLKPRRLEVGCCIKPSTTPICSNESTTDRNFVEKYEELPKKKNIDPDKGPNNIKKQVHEEEFVAKDLNESTTVPKKSRGRPRKSNLNNTVLCIENEEKFIKSTKSKTIEMENLKELNLEGRVLRGNRNFNERILRWNRVIRNKLKSPLKAIKSDVKESASAEEIPLKNKIIVNKRSKSLDNLINKKPKRKYRKKNKNLNVSLISEVKADDQIHVLLKPDEIKQEIDDTLDFAFDNSKNLGNYIKEEINLENDESEEIYNEETEGVDIKDEPMVERNYIRTEYKNGELAWARISKAPFWPCLITKEPLTGQLKRYFSNRISPLYHVRFFGDRGRRSWVSQYNILPFYGHDDPKYILRIFGDTLKGNFFSAIPKVMKNWERGVNEAESLIDKSVEDRLEFFFNAFASKREKNARKMKKLNDGLENLTKFKRNKRKYRRNYSMSSKKIKAEIIEDGKNDNKNIKSPQKNPLELKEIQSMSFKDPSSIKITKKRNSLENYSRIPTRQSSIESKDGDESKGGDEDKILNKENEDTKEEIQPSSDTESKASDTSSAMELQAALYRRNNIFKGISREKVCQLCSKSDNVQKCVGPCNGFYHTQCAIKYDNIKAEYNGDFDKFSLQEKIDFHMKHLMNKLSHYPSNDEEPRNLQPTVEHVTAETSYVKVKINEFKCIWCKHNLEPPCMICSKEILPNGTNLRQKCSVKQCGKFYHKECLLNWPQTQWSMENDKKDNFVCPQHVCHTCVADEFEAALIRCTDSKIVKCLNCPATYHSLNECVPAGSEILTTTQIICPRHFIINNKKTKTVNTTWCLICSKGGDLICCETCPTSVHIECLSDNDFNQADVFYCENCQNGRLPLYDEIVWVKCGSFRWWPALILFPNEIPDIVKNKPHNKGEFAVKFFGTYNHYWIGSGRAFLFQEGDSGHINNLKKKVDRAFARAVEEAAAVHQLKREFKLEKFSGRIQKPPPYVKIKVNKPVGNVRQFDGNISNTTSCDCDPNDPNPCGPDSYCLNRLLLTECNPEVCPAGEKCKNQSFEKREYPPLQPYKTSHRGWGLKTLAPIKKGQFVIEYVGEIIDECEYQKRLQKMHQQKEENYYFLTIDHERMLDAGPKGNVARFMNHSCQPNCETQKWTVNGSTRVGLFATKDIQSDTELTFNYNLECIGKEKKICKCEAPNCSGFIGIKVKPTKLDDKLKVKKKKIKQKIIEKIPLNNIQNPCFICGKFGDDIGGCSHKICNRFYHLNCVGINKWPDGNKWVCPWHYCNLCSKRTIRGCIQCTNSYCPLHSNGNIRWDRVLSGFMCSVHDPNNTTITVEKKENTIDVNVNKSLDEIRSSSEDVLITSKQIKRKRGRPPKISHSLKRLNLDVSSNDTANSPRKFLRTTRSSRDNGAFYFLDKKVPKRF